MTNRDWSQESSVSNRRGFLLVLNGPSSSGKSTVATAIQQQSNILWWSVSVDAITGLAEQSLKTLSGDSESNQKMFENVINMATKLTQQTAKELLDCGYNVILELVCQRGQGEAESWRATFDGYFTVWVGLDATLEELTRRESLRGDRVTGLAAWHKQRVHVGIPYDFTIETTELAPVEIARSILRKFYPSITNLCP